MHTKEATRFALCPANDLRRDMPLTPAAALLAALSLAGLPPLFGFVGKEMFYEAVWHSPSLGVILGSIVVVSGILLFAVAAIVGIGPFFGPKAAAKQHVRMPLRACWQDLSY